MATRLYLRTTTANVGSHARTKLSTALPVGTFIDALVGARDLSTSPGASAVDTNNNFNAATGDQDQYFCKFISAPLVASSITAQTWTLAVMPAEGSANANEFLIASVYVLKSDDTVRGYVYDSHTSLGTEFDSSAFKGRVVTFAGAAVAGVVSTDVLVLELWVHANPSAAVAYFCGIGYNGATTFVNDETGVSDPPNPSASYIETPQDLFSPTPAVTTNVRSFNGSSDRITMLPGTGPHSGYGGFLVVLKVDAGYSGYVTPISGRSAGGNGRCEFSPNNVSGLSVWNNASGSSMSVGGSLANSDGWCIIAVTKATGTATPRFHKCVLSGPTWGHSDGTSAIANWTIDTHWVLGAFPSYSQYYPGRIYCAAYWDAVTPSDADFETVTGLAAIRALNPSAFWVLDQASTLTAVPDSTSFGQSQDTISGTSVVSDTIPNFSGLPFVFQLSAIGAIG